jgi:hypothetical protein
MYFGGNISGQRVFILLCGSEHAAIEIANTEGITEVFGKMHKAHYGRYSNYRPSHKNG